jgi:hypothetical protein
MDAFYSSDSDGEESVVSKILRSPALFRHGDKLEPELNPGEHNSLFATVNDALDYRTGSKVQVRFALELDPLLSGLASLMSHIDSFMSIYNCI